MRRAGVVGWVGLFVGIAAWAPALADVLIYSDQSPGAIPVALVAKQGAELQGHVAILVTDASQFEQELASS